jgi:hypothetical protein
MARAPYQSRYCVFLVVLAVQAQNGCRAQNACGGQKGSQVQNGSQEHNGRWGSGMTGGGCDSWQVCAMALSAWQLVGLTVSTFKFVPCISACCFGC